MKRLAVCLLLALAPIATVAQNRQPPIEQPKGVKTSAPTATSDVAFMKIELALANYQLMEAKIQMQAQQQLAPLNQAVVDAVTEARKSKGLTADYAYDPETHAFVKQVPPANPAKPVEKPATPPQK